MSDYYQDRAAAVARAVLGAVAQYLNNDAGLRDYVTNLFRDEIYNIERQVAADREGDK